jgi:hypothetical protein
MQHPGGAPSLAILDPLALQRGHVTRQHARDINRDSQLILRKYRNVCRFRIRYSTQNSGTPPVLPAIFREKEKWAFDQGDSISRTLLAALN